MLAGRFDPGVVARVLALVVVADLAAGIAGAVTVPGPSATPPLSGSSSVESARFSGTVRASLQAYPARFLSLYMDPDGRVVRRDQGGDTVSEGQAYGMLISAAVGERADFSTIWSWTKAHLSRPDGLLAWHWQDGRVVDQMPASDADVDAAWALALAATRFASPALADEARRIASSTLEEETDETAIGPVLVAGPWAEPSGTTEPGYFAPEAFASLGKLTGDPRWSKLEATAGQVLMRAMSGRHLPAEWVSVSSKGAVVPTGSPSQPGGPPEYSLGAARVAAWWGADCSASGRQVAGSEWSLLAATARSGSFPISLSLSGQPEDSAVNPTMTVADGMAAAAAGQQREAASLLASAEQLDRRFPTYYGGAWLAFAYLLAATRYLSDCPWL